MGIFLSKVHDQHNASNHMEFVMDANDDITLLPGIETCAPGSKATSIESGQVYCLTTDGTWGELPKGGGEASLRDLSVTANGTYTPEADYDGFNVVNVNVPEALLESLNVTSNGTYIPDEGYDGFDSVEVNVESNPNYMETIVGTLANPWGNADYAQLVSDAASNNATVFISVPAMNFATYVIPVNDHFAMNGAIFSYDGLGTYNLDIAAYAEYLTTGTLERLLMWQNGATVDVTSMLSGAATTLTIVHHPLPEEP